MFEKLGVKKCEKWWGKSFLIHVSRGHFWSMWPKILWYWGSSILYLKLYFGQKPESDEDLEDLDKEQIIEIFKEANIIK